MPLPKSRRRSTKFERHAISQVHVHDRNLWSGLTCQSFSVSCRRSLFCVYHSDFFKERLNPISRYASYLHNKDANTA